MALKVDFSKFDKKLTKIASEFNDIVSVALSETAEEAIKTIQQRTFKDNKDKDGRSFARYSDAYAKHKKRKGQKGGVNLTSVGVKGDPNRQGGTMMMSIHAEKAKPDGSKYVLTAKGDIELDKLRANVRGEGHLPKRNPMGFTRAEDKRLGARASRQIEQKIKKIGQK